MVLYCCCCVACVTADCITLCVVTCPRRQNRDNCLRFGIAEVDCITYNLLLPFTSSVAILDSCSPLSVASSWYSVVFIHSAKYPWKSRLSYALHLHESSREHLMKHAEPTDHSCGCGYAQISYFQVPLRLLAWSNKKPSSRSRSNLNCDFRI